MKNNARRIKPIWHNTHICPIYTKRQAREAKSCGDRNFNIIFSPLFFVSSPLPTIMNLCTSTCVSMSKYGLPLFEYFTFRLCFVRDFEYFFSLQNEKKSKKEKKVARDISYFRFESIRLFLNFFIFITIFYEKNHFL